MTILLNSVNNPIQTILYLITTLPLSSANTAATSADGKPIIISDEGEETF